MGVTEAREPGFKKAIDPHTGFISGYGDILNARRQCGYHGLVLRVLAKSPITRADLPLFEG
jgi:hypothetical protein